MNVIFLVLLTIAISFCNSGNGREGKVEETRTEADIDEILIGEWGICHIKIGSEYLSFNECSSMNFTYSGKAVLSSPSRKNQSYGWLVNQDSMRLEAIGEQKKDRFFPDANYKMKFDQKEKYLELILSVREDQYFLGKSKRQF